MTFRSTDLLFRPFGLIRETTQSLTASSFKTCLGLVVYSAFGRLTPNAVTAAAKPIAATATTDAGMFG